LPLAVLAPVFANHMAVTTFEEMYERQRPLPLAELHPAAFEGAGPAAAARAGAAPSAGLPSSSGLLGLLKHALWQLLWVEAAPAGGWPAAAGGLRARVRAAAGALLGRLYDRNCRRAFAPVRAFYAAGLPPERFCAEAGAAAAGRGGLMEATHTRVWALMRCARGRWRCCLPSAPPGAPRARPRGPAWQALLSRAAADERAWFALFQGNRANADQGCGATEVTSHQRPPRAGLLL